MKANLTPTSINPCQFGDWRFDPEDGQLTSNYKQVRLQPRLAKLLAILVANVDTLLSRDELIAILWRDKSVNDEALSRCIAELRSALGDKSNAPIYIETIPKKGYRFIHPLEVKSVAIISPPATNINTFQHPSSIFSPIFFLLLLLASLAIAYSLYSVESTDSVVNKRIIEDKQVLKNALLSAKRITADTALEHQPEISHQGDKVAFSVAKNNRMIVKIINSDGKLLHEIEDNHYHLYSATFAPNDQSLLIAGIKQGNCLVLRYQLPSLTKEEITPCTAANTSGLFDFSPDGNSFAYVAQSKNSNETAIWRYNLKTKQQTQITKPTKLNVFDTRPKYSANGKQLAFTRGSHSIRNIYLTSLTNSANSPNTLESVITLAKPITKTRGFISSFSWLANSQQLIYDSNELGDRNLWLVDIETNKQELLGARDAKYPSLNTNNSRLVFQEVRYNANLWQVELNAKALPDKIIESIKYNNFPAFSPNGKQIAFVSNRQGKSAIWLYSTESKTQTKLLAVPTLDLLSPSWSNDGQRLIISSRGPDGYRCFQLDLKTLQHEIISAIKTPHYGCVYSPIGDIFAIAKQPSEISRLLKLNTLGEVVALTQFGVARVQVTNTDKLIYSLSTEDGLYSMNFNGQDRKTILKNFNHKLDENWTVQGNFLYYPKLTDKKGIWRKNLSTGEEEFVTKELPSAIGLTITINPEHSKMVFSRTDNRVSDVYLATMDETSKE